MLKKYLPILFFYVIIIIKTIDANCDTMISGCHTIVKKCDVTLFLRNVVVWHELLFTFQCHIIIN